MNNRRTQWQRRRKTSLTIFTSHFIARVQKGLLKVCMWEGAGDRTELKYFHPKVMAVSIVSFSFSRAAQPEAQGPLCWVMAFFIASYQDLLWTPTHQGPKPLRPGVAFPTTLVYNSLSNCLQLNWSQLPLGLELNWLDFRLDWVI